MMTREHRLTMADAAATRAAGLARQAQAAAEKSGNASDLAAAGAAWAELSQAHAAIAELMPKTEVEG